ncbi:MAG: helix-turn-helix domain-containing protein [Phenylobacterium sp.]
MKTDANPGAMLKNLRLQKGLKLVQLAALTGFPISTLSKMENGKMALTYDKMARVSKALEVDIGALFSPAVDANAPPLGTGRRSIMRAGDGQEIETNVYNHLYQAADLLNKRFVPIIAYPHAKSMEEFGDWVRHPGEEYTYVIEGTVDFYSELYAPVRLGQGDSIYFDSSMGHAYIKVGDAPCRGLTICAGDESQILPVQEKIPTPANDGSSSVPAPAQTKVALKASAPRKKTAPAPVKPARKARRGS